MPVQITRTIHDRECYVNGQTIHDQLIAYLYAATVLADDEEVLELTIGLPNAEGIYPIRYKTIKMKEPELIVHT